MKKNYFKKMKEPINYLEDAISIKKETKLYLIISIVLFLVFGIFSGIIESISVLFTLLAMVSFAAIIYFVIMMIKIKSRIMDLALVTCCCGRKYTKDGEIKWRELSHYWANSNDRAESLLMVRVEFVCTCSECGEEKTVIKTIPCGKLFYGARIEDCTKSTEEGVNKYLDNLLDE